MFMLSYSLGRLLELSSGVEIVHAFAQLMVEYEYYISNAMQQNMVCIRRFMYILF